MGRMGARTGGRRDVVYLPQDTHIPERAALPAPAQYHLAAATQAAWPVRILHEPPLRPLRLFDRPEPVKVPFATLPGRPPPLFTWSLTPHTLVTAAGTKLHTNFTRK